VYGTQSEAFPSLKIGRATSLKERISSGNTFCAPAKHVVVAAVPSFHPTRDERAAHAFFADQRAEGEFFHVTRQQVQSFFDECIMPQYQRELSEALARLQT
jgi:hypothetical protein